MIYKARDIRQWNSDADYGNGIWLPARPLPWYGFVGLKYRLQAALGVLTGRFDALDWEDYSARKNGETK